jgi:UDP-N-acetylglucosamine 4,6-dehydratase/5-epimerase
MLDNKSILVTGGSGSWGQEFVRHVLSNHKPKKIIIYSRDELKQFEMAHEFSDAYPSSPMRYFIGDVRDEARLKKAMAGVDIVIHAAAIKQVPTAEYNPTEAVATNIAGTQNVINAVISCKVKKMIFLSTDKAVEPCNLYGCTKAVAEKLVVNANLYSGSYPNKQLFSVVRYGNVMGSRGSVIPYFRKLAKEGQNLPITDKAMTRFWITLPQAVEFVVKALRDMQGGEIFVPKLPAMDICSLAKAVAPGSEIFEVGIRPGEKIHEKLISNNERNVVEEKDRYVILPT